METYKYIVAAMGFALVILSAVYVCMIFVTNLYMTIFFKSFWQSFNRKSAKRLMIPRFITKVEDFFKMEAYRELESTPFRSFAVLYGPVHAYVADKLIPIVGIAVILAVVLLPGILSLFGME